MDFYHAECLMWEMLKLAWQQTKDRKKATCYEVRKIGLIQREILESIAQQQYITLRDETQRLIAFATWIIDDSGLMYVSNAVTTKHHQLRTMIAIVRKNRTINGVRWHRPKNGKNHKSLKQRGI